MADHASLTGASLHEPKGVAAAAAKTLYVANGSGSGAWAIPDYQSMPAGSVVQVVNVLSGAVATGTTVTPYDDTIPQITEGVQYMSLAITPKATTHKLLIAVVAHFSLSFVGHPVAALFQDATASALAAASIWVDDTRQATLSFNHYMTAGTVSATTFKVRLGSQSGTLTFNGQTSARKLGGVLASSITITEFKA